MSRVLSSIVTQPWAITEAALESIIAIASRENLADEIEKAFHAKPLSAATSIEAGDPVEGTFARQRGNVGIVSLEGPIFKSSSMFSRLSGASSAETLARDLTALDAMPGIKAIVLDVDSPGGQITGLMELTEIIRGLDTKVVAHVGGMAASAAFHIISATDRIVMSPSALAGSVGVVMSVTDMSEREKQAGIKRTEIVSSQSPMKRISLDSDDGMSAAQKIVDQQAALMIEDIAANLGITPEKVEADFGRGGLLIAQDAVKAGMADAIGSFESVLASLQSDGFAQTPLMEASMPDETKTAATANTATVHHPEVLTAAYLRDTAPKAVSDISAESAKAERTRIFEILELAAPGHEQLRAALAKDPDMDAGEAAKQINAALGADVLEDMEAGDEGVAASVETNESSEDALVKRVLGAGVEGGN